MRRGGVSPHCAPLPLGERRHRVKNEEGVGLREVVDEGERGDRNDESARDGK